MLTAVSIAVKTREIGIKGSRTFTSMHAIKVSSSIWIRPDCVWELGRPSGTHRYIQCFARLFKCPFPIFYIRFCRHFNLMETITTTDWNRSGVIQSLMYFKGFFWNSDLNLVETSCSNILSASLTAVNPVRLCFPLTFHLLFSINVSFLLQLLFHITVKRGIIVRE